MGRSAAPPIRVQVCGASADARRLLADFAIGFLRHVDTEYLPLGDSYASTVKIVLYPDQAAFQARMRSLRTVQPPPQFAWYDPLRRQIHSPAGVNPGYLAHELMHPVVETQLPARARWAAEGIPLFFEQFTATRRGGRWHWRGFGEHSPERIRALGDTIPDINLRFTLQQRQMRYHNAQSEVRMLVIYLWQRGRFREFLQLVGADRRNGFDSHFEAALQSHLETIEADWRRWLQAVHDARDTLAQGAPAMIIVEEEN